MDPGNPLLERLRFLDDLPHNLDEFFMIRVSGIKQQIAAGVDLLTIDGLPRGCSSPRSTSSCARWSRHAQRCLTDDILPALAAHGVEVLDWADLTRADKRWLAEYFQQKVLPILTPLAVGPTHRFPFISNLSLNIGVVIRSPEGEERVSRVKLPLANVPRLVPIGPTPKLQPPCGW